MGLEESAATGEDPRGCLVNMISISMFIIIIIIVTIIISSSSSSNSSSSSMISIIITTIVMMPRPSSLPRSSWCRSARLQLWSDLKGSLVIVLIIVIVTITTY